MRSPHFTEFHHILLIIQVDCDRRKQATHSRFSLTECTLAASSTTRRGWPRAPGLISGLSAEFSIFGKDISATGVLQAQMSKKGLPQATAMQSTPDSPMPMSYYVS